MASQLPLSALLSQALVGFTTEFDNEFERQMPHRTTRHGRNGGVRRAPWLVSMAMYLNCMRFVGREGITLGELEKLALAQTNLNGMMRWGYIMLGPSDGKKPRKSPGAKTVIQATPAGQKSREIWQDLFPSIEKRWEARFGKEETGLLRKTLASLVGKVEIDLPDCMPILGYGLRSRIPELKRVERARSEAESASGLPLPVLFSKLLLAFALEFERDSDLSLAISANILRLVGEDGVRVRDLAQLSAVSKEAVAIALSFLVKGRYVVVEPEAPKSRVKVVRLTPKGREAQEKYYALTRTIENGWRKRFGDHAIQALRDSLERLCGDGTAEGSPLFSGLEPYPEGWRASVPKPEWLPHYPMVSHRGGFPDGS